MEPRQDSNRHTWHINRRAWRTIRLRYVWRRSLQYRQDMSSNPEPVDFRSSVELILFKDQDGLFNAANDLTQIPKYAAIEVSYLLAIEHGVKEAYLNYGWFLRGINRPKEAIAQFQKTLEIGDPQAAYLSGRNLPGDGQTSSGHKMAAPRWRKSSRAAPLGQIVQSSRR